MLLRRGKIPASSIAEVVIAVAVIGLCIGIASLIFIRSTRVTINFQDVRKQTEIQSELWKKLYQQETELEDIEDVFVSTEELEQDSLKLLVFKASDDKVIWKQEWIK